MQNIKIDDLRVGSTIIFENTGAYAVTEGMALFLSHVLPAVVLYDPVGGFTQVRGKDARLMFGTHKIQNKRRNKNGRITYYLK